MALDCRSVLNTDQVRIGPQYRRSNGSRRTSPMRSIGSSFLQSLHSSSGAYQSFTVGIKRPGRETEQSLCLVRNLEMNGAVPSLPFIACTGTLPVSVTSCLIFSKMDVALHIIPQSTAHHTLLVLGTWILYKFYFRVDLLHDLHLICSDG